MFALSQFKLCLIASSFENSLLPFKALKQADSVIVYSMAIESLMALR